MHGTGIDGGPRRGTGPRPGVLPGQPVLPDRRLPTGAGYPSRPAHPGRGYRGLLGLGAVIVACGLAAGLGAGLAGRPDLQGQLQARLSRLPGPPADARPGRVLPQVQVPDAGQYAFLRTRPDGSPVAYDPCRPIHVVINPTGAPAGGQQAVEAALTRLSAASGLAFVIDGSTEEVPDFGRDDRAAGGGWAPVLIGWGTQATHSELAGSTAGVGGSVSLSVRSEADTRYVTGQVVLDAEDIGAFEFGRRARVMEAIVLHELAHVIGLDHVDAPTELMNPVYTGMLDLGPGDRAGLARLGAGTCHTDT